MKKQHFFKAVIGLLAFVSIILLIIDYFVDLSIRWLFILYGIDLVMCLVFARSSFTGYDWRRIKRFFLKSNGYKVLAMVPVFVFYAAG